MVSKSTLQKSSECRSLVIWGTNLSSTVRSGSLTKQEREMMKFSPFQLSVIVGLILSDGYLAYSNKRAKTARLVFEQSLDHSARGARRMITPAEQGRSFSIFLICIFIIAPYCSSYPSIGPAKNSPGTIRRALRARRIYKRTLNGYRFFFSMFFHSITSLFYRTSFSILSEWN